MIIGGNMLTLRKKITFHSLPVLTLAALQCNKKIPGKICSDVFCKINSSLSLMKIVIY